MTTEQQQVKDWMSKFGQETPAKPEVPSLEIRKLRAKLVLEEAIELITALGLRMTIGRVAINDLQFETIDFSGDGYGITEGKPLEPNLVEIADALADLHYVGYCGTGVACGLEMEEIFEEVHRSNMSKLWTGTEFQNNERHELLYGLPIDGDYSSYNTKTWLVKNKDGKVIKSPSYSPANIKPLLEAQQ